LCFLGIAKFYWGERMVSAVIFIVFFTLCGCLAVYIKFCVLGCKKQDPSEVIEQIKKVDGELNVKTANSDMYVSRLQLETLQGMVEESRNNLNKIQNGLSEIEDKLANEQTQVEEKEVRQQEMKALNAEDENKLTELLSSYEKISAESRGLEQRLASSLEQLDEASKELDLTPDQKNSMDELSNSLASASGLLRSLISEYDDWNERLVQMNQQQSDLEAEYTRLVEQQLQV